MVETPCYTLDMPNKKSKKPKDGEIVEEEDIYKKIIPEPHLEKLTAKARVFVKEYARMQADPTIKATYADAALKAYDIGRKNPDKNGWGWKYPDMDAGIVYNLNLKEADGSVIWEFKLVKDF